MLLSGICNSQQHIVSANALVSENSANALFLTATIADCLRQTYWALWFYLVNEIFSRLQWEMWLPLAKRNATQAFNTTTKASPFSLKTTAIM